MNKEREEFLKENHIRAFEEGKYKSLLKQENTNLKQTLIDIREYMGKFIPIDEDTILIRERQRDYILQIIDKILGDDNK